MRQQDFDEIFSYSAEKLEQTACNYCQQDDCAVLNRQDRYGFPITSVICKQCGLIYINPRMSKEGYQRFYENAYRRILNRFHSSNDPHYLDNLFAVAKQRGASLVNWASPHLKTGLTIEVGSSCGGILALFKELGNEVLGIEPAPEEAAYAERHGIPTKIALIEDFNEPLPLAQNVVIARSLNHLLDPRKFFTWAHQQLLPGGHFISMTYDFVYMCQVEGKIKTQIDHPFMFSDKTLVNFIKSAGFRPIASQRRWLFEYVVAQKEEVEPFRKIFFDAGEYTRVKRTLNPAKLRLRYYLYQLKKIFRKHLTLS